MKNKLSKATALLVAAFLVVGGVLPTYATGDKSSPLPSKSTSKTEESAAKSESKSASQGTTARYGKNPNDNSAVLADDANYYYRVVSVAKNQNRSTYIERISKKDKTTKVIRNFDADPRELNVLGDYIYFVDYTQEKNPSLSHASAIFRMKKDGSDLKQLATVLSLHSMLIVNDKLYYVGQPKPILSGPHYGELWEMNLDGTGAKKLDSHMPALYYMVGYKGNVIYSGRGSTTDVMMYNPKTKAITKLAKEVEKSWTTSDFFVVGDTLYFTSTSDYHPSKLMTIDIPSKSAPKEVACDFELRIVTYEDGYYYYYNSKDGAVYRTNKLKGGTKTKLTGNKLYRFFSVRNGAVAAAGNEEGTYVPMVYLK